MDIIVAPDIFTHHINKYLTFPKTNIDIQIRGILENENNTVVINKAYVEYIEETINENLHDFYSLYMTELINKKSIKVSSTKYKDKIELLQLMYDEYKANHMKPKTIFFIISIYKSNNIGSDRSACLELINKPNFHWLTFKLLESNPSTITVRHFDFKDNKEIEQFFSDYYFIANHDNVKIYDRYLNLNHRYFSTFSQVSNVEYFTTLDINDINYKRKKESLRKTFNRLKCYSSHKNNIHERKIIVGNLILETDEDFRNITVARNTWKIDVCYCSNSVKGIYRKNVLFREVKF